MENKNIDLIIDDVHYQTLSTHAYENMLKWKKNYNKNITAIIPGTIIEIFVKEGQKVKEGDLMMIVEAMKMNNRFVFSSDGIIDKIHVKTGDIIAKNQLLITLK